MPDENLISRHIAGDSGALDEINRHLEAMSAELRVRWAMEYLPGTQILTSSFGIHSAVMLHLLTSVKADIHVILVDTGYLFNETYQFIDELSDRLKLNLHVYRSPLSTAWQEARFGRLWEQGLAGLEIYNRINKVEPMKQALDKLGAGTWFAGLRRQQAGSRSELPVLRVQDGYYKIHPVIDWSSRDVHRYLTQHELPYHPLRDQGYVSVGDNHTSHPLTAGMGEKDARFFGLKRECGLHE